jgi:uncharacterized protein (TIGR02118 family)
LEGIIRYPLGKLEATKGGSYGTVTQRERGSIVMIRLSVFYPSTEGATFDHDYYRNKHVPLAVKTWGLEGAEIDKGVDGPYVAAVHFKFESPEALAAAMSNEKTGDVLADVANYTSIAPVLQTSEIVT